MASDRVLALNIGAGHVTLGELRVASGKPPVLQRYGIAPLGLDPDSEMDPSGFIIAALTDIMKATGIRPGPLMLSVSGQTVFPRFVKLPSVAQDKLRTMIQSEAEQNVPFPIDELTWDFQMVGAEDAGERNAMIVAAKTESIVALTNAVAAVGLEPEVVDVAPLAIYNCVRYCYPNLEGCTMVLDIGARSTNLVFIEEGKVFYRSIPVAGNTITQEIAKTFQVDFRKAELMKRESGYVALGGVTADADEDADRMSKCIRSVVTRLHAEVNRSINFYRSQQGGSVPVRVLLTGGSATLQHIDTFFREKLRVDVDYLNPYGGVNLGSHVNQEKAAAEFYQLAEVIGMAVRRGGQGSVSINLMPPNLVDKKTFRRRVPVFAVAGISLVAASAFLLLGGGISAGVAEYERDAFQRQRDTFKEIGGRIAARVRERDAIVADFKRYCKLIADRAVMIRRLDAIRASLLPGMWLVSIDDAEFVGADGVAVPGVKIVGRGFSDALKKVEQQVGAGKTSPELFCDRLVGKAPFAEARVTAQKNVDNVGEFTVEASLADDYRFELAAGEEE